MRQSDWRIACAVFAVLALRSPVAETSASHTAKLFAHEEAIASVGTGRVAPGHVHACQAAIMQRQRTGTLHNVEGVPRRLVLFAQQQLQLRRLTVACSGGGAA
jgi:hypothetical protein